MDARLFEEWWQAGAVFAAITDDCRTVPRVGA
jgi:hypothetical protein